MSDINNKKKKHPVEIEKTCWLNETKLCSIVVSLPDTTALYMEVEKHLVKTYSLEVSEVISEWVKTEWNECNEWKLWLNG